MSLHFQQFFDSFGYVVLAPGEAPSDAITNFPDEWKQAYFRNAFHQIDPVFDFARANAMHSNSILLPKTEMETEFFEEARVFGADSNFVCVSHFGGNTMVFGGVNHDLDERQREKVQQACQIEHRRTLVARVADLTDTQHDVLDMTEEGLKDKMIAAELGVTLSAIAQRKKGVCRSIGLSSYSAALALYSQWKWNGVVADPQS